MCVIYANYSGIPSLDELKKGEERNSDGAGIAWVEDGKVYWEKGLDAPGIHEVLKKVKLPNMVHFRNATIGPPTPPMTHPFPLTPRVPLFLKGYSEGGVLMHNGTLGDWKKLVSEACLKSGRKLPGGDWSDSRALAWLVANFGEGLLTARETDLVFGQRIAILSPDGQLKRWGASWPLKADEGKGYIQSCPTSYKIGKASLARTYPGYSGHHSADLWDDRHSGGGLSDVDYVEGKVVRKVASLGNNPSYHFNPMHERKLEPIRHLDVGLVVDGGVVLDPPIPKVTIITSVKKDSKAPDLEGGVLIYSKPELEKVMASLAAQQEKLALNRMKIITFPRKSISH